MAQLYAALDPAQSQVRLLRLEPAQTPSLENGRLPASFGTNSDETRPFLHFTMDTVSLDDEPRFCALSYVWGDPTDTTTIVVNDIETPITKSLFAAVIVTLKYQTRPPFWADALCINQQDNAERCSQVRLMSRIYKQALRINSHLGKLTPNVEAYVHYHDLVHDHRTDDHWVQAIRSWDEQGVPSTEQADKIVAILAGQTELRRSEYFQRIWTFQELYLSMDRALFFVGDLLIKKFHMRKICWIDPPRCISGALRETVYNSGPSSASNRAIYDQITEVLLFKVKEVYSINLGSLLYATRQRFCSEPRDKIFGVLSLLPTVEAMSSNIARLLDSIPSAVPDDKKQIAKAQFGGFREDLLGNLARTEAAREKYLEIDYEKPIKEVFRDALYYIAAIENRFKSTLGSLCLWYKPYMSTSPVEDNDMQRSRVSYPSWLPDMASPRPGISFDVHADVGAMAAKPLGLTSNIEWLPRDLDKGYGDRLRFRVTSLGHVVHTLIFPDTSEAIMDLVSVILRETWPRTDRFRLDQFDEIVVSEFHDEPSEKRRPDPAEELLQSTRELVSLIKPPSSNHPLSTPTDKEPDSLVPSGIHRLLNSLLLADIKPRLKHGSTRKIPAWLELSHHDQLVEHTLPATQPHRCSLMTSVEERLAGRALFVLDSGVCGLSSGDVEIGDIAALSGDFGHPMVIRSNLRTSRNTNDTDEVGDDESVASRQTHVLVDYASIAGVVDDEYNDSQTIVLG